MGQTPSLPRLAAAAPAERRRLLAADDAAAARAEPWRRWGCFLADRQWGTVREDYSRDGNAWAWFTHDDARARAYRSGEDGLLGWCDEGQLLCFSLAMWNGKDPIVKERLFGLTNDEGPHGEGVKEHYVFDDALPTAAYMRATYRYPIDEFPYAELARRNGENRGKLYETGEYYPEVHLHECGALQDSRFWDVTVEYAKNTPEDVSIRVSATNRSAAEEELLLMPSLYYRNTWSWVEGAEKPRLAEDKDSAPHAAAAAVSCDPARYDARKEIPPMTLLIDGVADSRQLLFCDNNTNIPRFEGRSICRDLYKNPATDSPYVKNNINDDVIAGRYHEGPRARDDRDCNPDNFGTKMCSTHRLIVPAGETKTLVLRLLPTADVAAVKSEAFDERIFDTRKTEADQFYEWASPQLDPAGDHFCIQRQAYAGMLWTRQTYIYDIGEWLRVGPKERLAEGQRNRDWIHCNFHDVLSVCDGWEYPWHASWDLAFHLIVYAHIDPGFAKKQALLLFSPGIVHPKGMPPSYEWDFSDYSPPLAAFAAWMIYDVERSLVRENGDKRFLRRMFFALNNFYSWYVNLADHRLIGGSFLGLDNSQVLNRSKMHEYPAFEAIYQVDGTAWCAAMGMAMMKIALELDMGEAAALFFCNAVCRGHAMNNFEDGLERPGFARPALWSEGMGWYLDCVKYTGKQELQSLKCRTLIGMVPLFAAQCFFSLDELAAKHPLFADHVAEFTWAKLNKQHTQKVISVPVEDLPVPVEEEQTVLVGGDGSRRLGMFLTDKEKLRVMLRSILDEDRFLSAYGIRSASKELEREPYNFDCGDGHGWKQYKYLPRESYSDGKLFGGNSSWRGAIWMPTNYFLLHSLLQYHDMFGEEFVVEFPTGSGVQLNLKEVSIQIAKRLVRIFEKRADGTRATYGTATSFYNSNPLFATPVLFYEYFDGDTGEGVGASHQTGWTGLVADLISRLAHTGNLGN